MKHLFFIHSHTLFLTSIGVKQYLNISDDDTIFIYARNYNNSLFNLNFKTVDISILYSSLQVDRHKRMWKDKKYREEKIKEIDELINNITNNDVFEIYVPHLSFCLFKIASTHPNCTYTSYVQEGGVPFSTAFSSKFDFIHTVYFYLYNMFAASPRMKKNGRWYDKTLLKRQSGIKTYSISDSFFQHMPTYKRTNCIVKWPSCDLQLNFNQESPIFVFDGFVFNHHIEKEYYLDKCKRIVEEEAGPTNYIKFHPVQPEEERNVILSYFRNIGCEVSILKNDIPMEIVISSTEKMKYVGFGSSLLFFARDYGHDVVCRDEWLAQSPLYKEYKDNAGFLWFNETNNKK